MKPLHFVLPLFLFTVSCVTPPNPKFENISPEAKAMLEETKAEILKVDACSQQAKGNDAKFTADCGKLLDKKKMYALFRRVNSLGSFYEVTADVSGAMFIVCRIESEEKGLTEKLAALKENDGVYVTGSLDGFQKYEYPYVNRIHPDKYTYSVKIRDCKLDLK
jgi:hypothetical protein